MTDFPEKIWLNLDYEDGGLMEWGSRQLSPAASEYIRADLVTQWQPIETLREHHGDVLLSIVGGFTRIGFINADGDIREQDGRTIKGGVTNWMPIPKVPE